MPSHPAQRPCLVVLGLGLALGGLACAKTSGPDEGASDLGPQLCASGSGVATLYPKDRLVRNDALRKRLLAVPWMRHSSSYPHDVFGDDMKLSHRNTDLKFTEESGALSVAYELDVGTEGSESERTEWTKTCEVCGELLICGDEFSTVRIRDGAVSRKERTFLDFTAYVPTGERGYYFLRFGFEVALQFETDPMTSDSGSVALQMRKLEAGSSATKASATFESEEYGLDDRKVEFQLPDDLGSVTMVLRDTKDGHIEGRGAPKFVPDGTLFDATKM